MPVVALDTSALMLPVELGIRVFEELEAHLGEVEPVVPESVRSELDRLAAASGTTGTAAAVGADLAARCGTVASATDRSDADAALVDLAADRSVDYVATADRDLADRVLATGTPVIAPRGERTLRIIEP